LRNVLCPAWLSPYYEPPNPVALSNPKILAGVVVACVVTAAAAICLRRTRAVLAIWLIFIVLLSPMSGVVKYAAEWVFAFDNYLYLPLVAFVMLPASLLAWLFRRDAPGRRGIWRAGTAALLLFVVVAEGLTARRCLANWRDSVGLAEHMRESAPQAAQVNVNLGSALATDGRFDDAVAPLRAALKVQPDMPDAHYNLGFVLASLGRYDQAIRHFRQVLAVEPVHVKAMNNLGSALVKLGRRDEALGHFRRAIETKPAYAMAHLNLGNALRVQGDFDGAIMHYRRTVSITPGDADTWKKLGLALTQTGVPDEARRCFQEAVRLEPASAELLASVAWVLATHPDFGARDAGEAVRLARRAARLTSHQDVRILDALAAACAATGQFDLAVTHARAALALAAAAHDGRLKDRIGTRLKGYQQGKRYVLPAPAREAGRSQTRPPPGRG
jgi:Flp pilus assembly protein TadD